MTFTQRAGFAAVLFLGSTAALQAQISITSADLPSAGSSYRISTADTLLAIDPESTGADFTWDFSFLTSLVQTEEAWVSPIETDLLYFLLFGVSNLAQEVPVPEIPGLELTDAYNFYRKNSSRFAQSGLAGQFTGVPIVIPFEDEDQLFSLPLNYGDTETDSSAFELVVPTIATLREERVRVGEVDGWGTLITPYGTFDVLRHRAAVAIWDTLSGSLGNFATARQTIEYRWLGTGQGAPLLQIDVQQAAGVSFISRIAYQDSLAPVPSGLSTYNLVAGSLFPNPAQTEVTLQTVLPRSGEVVVKLLREDGVNVQAWRFPDQVEGAFRQTLTLDELRHGWYVLQLEIGEDRGYWPLLIR